MDDSEGHPSDVDKKREAQRRWYEKHRAEQIARASARYYAHREEVLQRQKEKYVRVKQILQQFADRLDNDS